MMNLNETSNKVFRIEYLLLCLILLYSFYLRITYLDNDSLWLDETLSAVTAKGIIEHGYPMLESGYVHNRALLFHHGMAFFINVFGGDFGARFISVVFGVLTVYLAYLFSKEFIKKSNWIFPLLVCVSSLEIIYSKQARFYQAFQFFYFLSFYLFYKIVIKKSSILNKKWLDYSLLILSILLSVHLQDMGYIILPLFLLIYLLNHINKDLFHGRSFYLIIILGLVLTFLAIFSVRYFFNLNFWTSASYYFNFILNNYIEYTPLLIISIIGILFSYKEDENFNISLLIYSILPFIGLLFLNIIALRYIYFLVFPFFFFISFFFKKLKFKTIFLLILFIIFSTSVFSFKGVESLEVDPFLVLSDFKGAYAFINSLNSTLPVVSFWTPPSTWYDTPADYGFAFDEFSEPFDNYFNYEGREKFTNGSLIYNISDFPDKFIIVLSDEEGSDVKFSNIYPDFVEFYNSSCNEIFTSYNIQILNCTK